MCSASVYPASEFEVCLVSASLISSSGANYKFGSGIFSLLSPITLSASPAPESDYVLSIFISLVFWSDFASGSEFYIPESDYVLGIDISSLRVRLCFGFSSHSESNHMLSISISSLNKGIYPSTYSFYVYADFHLKTTKM